MKRALILSIACLSACDPGSTDGPGWPPLPPGPLPSDQPGPYEVGATTLEERDHRGTELTLEVWYPAFPPADAEREPYEPLRLGDGLFRDVPLDPRGAPYPLVAFSHGYGGIRYQSSYLTTWLASHGFVVVAVDHPRNSLLDLDSDAFAEVAVARPADVSGAVDIALAELPGYGTVDDGYGMVGHSFGAWTSLVIGGGQLDRQSLVDHCAATDDAGCGFVDADALLAIEDLSPASPDPRARVAVALAPGLHYAFGPEGEGLAGNIPTLVQGGDQDGDMPYGEEIRPVFAALPATAALATLHGGAHFGFSDLCAAIPFGPECDGAEEGYMEIERMHTLSRTLTTAWLRSRWLGEASQEVFLEPLAVADDLTWE